jgi:RHS repeat-associated protein
VTHYIWERGRVLGEYNGSTGANQVLYWYIGQRLFKKTGTTTQVYLRDLLSIRLALSDIGAVVGRQGHLPFGEDFAESGTQQKQHFSGYERDGESGTDYAVNRQYNQSVGRFNRPDPLSSSESKEAPQNWNRYSYAENEPVGQTDPSGLNLAPPPCGGGGGGEGGGDDGDSPPVPIPIPTCAVRVYDRLAEFTHGIPLPGARHGYIVFTASIFGFDTSRVFFEGQKDGHRLIASGATTRKQNVPLIPGYLPEDRPERDRKDGERSGVDVCLWVGILAADVVRVNSVPKIRYHWYGPNSTSVLRYMLESLPERGWYQMPFMVGYGSKLPGLEI